MIYFGCKNTSGHFLYRPDGKSSSLEVRHILEDVGIYPAVDGGFCPGAMREPDGGVRRAERGPAQKQGLARLSHYNGWTILAFWDRSVDNRYGSNSAFLQPDYSSFDVMLAKAKEIFPWVWSRFTFQVKLYTPQPYRSK